ncbi:hypothetical protein TA05_12760 [Citrobacter rodentium]|nr:hypothetical protein TA05_12760 [Citrobacter rodentium]
MPHVRKMFTPAATLMALFAERAHDINERLTCIRDNLPGCSEADQNRMEGNVLPPAKPCFHPIPQVYISQAPDRASSNFFEIISEG